MKKNTLQKIPVILLSVLLFLQSATVYGLSLETVSGLTWESKVQPGLMEKVQNLSGKIPVWLWMEDIDHNEVAQQVYENTGLREENLEVINESITNELATSVVNMENEDAITREKIKTDFQAYLNRTEPARRIEAYRVETYLNELRAVQNNMIRVKNESIFSELGLSEDDIIISETQAPVYIVNVDKNDIPRLAKHPKIKAIYYYKNETVVPEGNSILEVINGSTISRIRNDVGLTGNGVKIGVIDEAKVQPTSDLASSRITYVDPSRNYYSSHSTAVARISAGTNGVAPSAQIYSASGDLITAITNLSDEGVSVANYSMGASRTESYTAMEIYVDYIVRQKRFALVKSAGNSHGVITSPGLAYNVITVGGFFNQGTTDQSDDTMYSGSNYDNLSGCFKPDVVADQSDVDGTGTSYAAPFVTGTIALLYQLRPTLATQPEAVKAILMASCHRKAKPSGNDPIESMSTGLTAHQGAGVIDPYKAIAIAGSGHYGIRTLASSDDQETIRFNQPSYGATGLNVSLAWSAENPSSTVAGAKINLNLRLLRNNTQLKSSIKSTSSTEMVYVTPSSSNTNYTIQVDRSSATGTPVRYAYAFSLSRSRYQFTGITEGVYYLKNKATGLYLTMNNGTVTQAAFSNSSSQRWLLSDGRIAAVTTANNRLSIGATISGNYKRAITNTSYGASVINQMNSTNYERDGSYSFVNGSTSTALGIYNQSSASGASVAWSPYTSTNEYQKWYIEPVAYQRGDVNFSGSFASNDAQMVLEYSVGSRTFSDLQKFLADANGDGDIDSNDSLIINQIISGVID